MLKSVFCCSHFSTHDRSPGPWRSVCTECLQATCVRAQELRLLARRFRSLRAADRREREQEAQIRRAPRGDCSGAFGEARLTVCGDEPPAGGAVSSVEDWPFPPHFASWSRSPGSWEPAIATRLFVWGYGEPEGVWLRAHGRQTREARRVAREHGWDEEQAGAWAWEFVWPGPPSLVLPALELLVRADRAVAGCAGQMGCEAVSRWPALAGSSASAAPHGASTPPGPAEPPNQAAIHCDWPGRAVSTPSDGTDPLSSARLARRASAAQAEAQRLQQSLITGLERSRALRAAQARIIEQQPGMRAQAPGSEPTPRHPGEPASWPPRQRGAAGTRELSLPEGEFQALNEVVTHAHELAAAGCLAAGYGVLLAGRRRAEEAAAAGLPWAADLREIYRLALDNYIGRYGLKLE